MKSGELPRSDRRGLDGALGFDILELTRERVVAQVEVHDSIRQRFGLVHGGAYCAIAEFMASEGTNAGVRALNKNALGEENSTHFLRPVFGGTLRAVAVPRHRGRSRWVWDVDFRDADDKLCAVSRVAVAVREREPDARPLWWVSGCDTVDGDAIEGDTGQF